MKNNGVIEPENHEKIKLLEQLLVELQEKNQLLVENKMLLEEKVKFLLGNSCKKNPKKKLRKKPFLKRKVSPQSQGIPEALTTLRSDKDILTTTDIELIEERMTTEAAMPEENDTKIVDCKQTTRDPRPQLNTGLQDAAQKDAVAPINSELGTPTTSYSAVKHQTSSTATTSHSTVKYQTSADGTCNHLLLSSMSKENSEGKMQNHQESFEDSEPQQETQALQLEDQYKTVIYKKRMNKNANSRKPRAAQRPNPILGNNEKCPLQPSQRGTCLFISGLEAKTSADIIKQYIEANLNVTALVTKMKTKTAKIKSSFKVEIPSHVKDQIMSPEMWPKGTIVNFFLRLRQSPEYRDNKNAIRFTKSQK
nr:unnamed protein product [Callosobruchus analis]